MFFTPELLQRRDSGFGLLWLAATLGSKSSLRKLPRKGILHADIPQLCGMITDPEEPLALRLSANLMVGVIRVYHARHELWANDVTHTFTTLKKAVSTMYAVDAAGAGTLEMAQGTVRPDAITLTDDALRMEGGGLDFDFAIGDFGMDEFAIPRGPTPLPDSSFAPTPDNARANAKGKQRAPNLANPRSITLDETHLLPLQHSDPYDFHFDDGIGGPGSSSVGARAGAGISSEGNELFGGMEFAAEGWGGGGEVVGVGMEDGRIDLGLGLDEGWGGQGMEGDGWGIGAGAGDAMDLNLNFDGLGGPSSPSTHLSSAVRRAMQPVQRRALGLPNSSPHTPPLTHSRTPSDEDGARAQPGLKSALKRPADGDAEGEGAEQAEEKKPPRKRVKILLDQRIELTDAELIASREGYFNTMQRAWRTDIARRPHGWVADMLGAQNVPEEYEGKELKDFWTSVVTARLEARKRRWSSSSDSPESEDEDEQGNRKPKQRRLTQPPSSEDRVGQGRGRVVYPDDELMPGDMGMMDGQQDWNGGGWGDQQVGDQQIDEFGLPDAAQFTIGTPRLSQLRSGTPLSVEHGRGPSSLSNPHSASFPWDANPGGPSSSSWVGPLRSSSAGRRSGSRSGLASPVVEMADARVKQDANQREGSLGPSELGSTPTKKLVEGSQGQLETFEGFPEAATQQSQPEAESLATLERNALNFLEYIKMQRNAAMPGGGGQSLTLAQIVPAYAQTRHVAANAFYNCLVLATKGLLGVRQDAPYEEIHVRPL